MLDTALIVLYAIVHHYLTLRTVDARALDSHARHHWHSVQRDLHAPDIIRFTDCTSYTICATMPGATALTELLDDNPLAAIAAASNFCTCQCKSKSAVFLPSTSSCVARLDECRFQIAFLMFEQYRQWMPTFSIPATNSIFAPASKILWNESGSNIDKFDIGASCIIHDVFVQHDHLWQSRNNSLLFHLESFNDTTNLMWKGNEFDARKLEGSIVQLKLRCGNKARETYCIAFRIAGVHVNSDLMNQLSEIEWNRIELIVCILLVTLFIITLFGGLALWKVCWRSKKAKLISALQIQFLYHIKQQQLYMEEQLSIIKANFKRQAAAAYESDDGQQSPIIGVQKRKLYFSSEFLDPNLLLNPPPMAEQFVCELRKMIEIAKERIRMKRHVPTLHTIIEDGEHEGCANIAQTTSKCVDEELGDDEGSSPKSTNSGDSGCESLGDDDLITTGFQFDKSKLNAKGADCDSNASDTSTDDRDVASSCQQEMQDDKNGNLDDVSANFQHSEEQSSGQLQSVNSNNQAGNVRRANDNDRKQTNATAPTTTESVTVSLLPSRIPVIIQTHRFPSNSETSNIRTRTRRLSPAVPHRPSYHITTSENQFSENIRIHTPKTTYAIFPNTDFILNKSISRCSRKPTSIRTKRTLSPPPNFIPEK